MRTVSFVAGVCVGVFGVVGWAVCAAASDHAPEDYPGKPYTYPSSPRVTP